MKHLDTFSGIGGWALAARWMGWETLAFVEKEKFCHKVLNKNFPNIPIHDDIFTFSGNPFRGRVDVLTGSTPCQPFSQAGKREGSNDERHLFPEFLRVVAEVEPRWIIIENVYGLLSIESGQVFEDYHASLESEGYSVQTVCIPASALNAPHRRDRLWIVARADADSGQARSRDVTESVRAKFAESCSNSTDASHALNSEHRANGRPQSEADGIQGIGGAEGLSGRVSGTVGDVADSASERPRKAGRLRRDESQERIARVGEDVRNTASHDARTVGAVRSRASAEPRRSNDNARYAESTGQPSGPNGQGQAQYGRASSGLLGFEHDWVSVAARFCRVDDVVPFELDVIRRGLNAEINITKTDTERNFIEWQVLRSVWENRELATTSPGLYKDRLSDCMPGLPQGYSHSGWLLGERLKEDEGLSDLWQAFFAKPFNEAHDLQQRLSARITEIERRKKKESGQRVSRLKSLGNAIVPSIAYELFTAIEAADDI